MAEEPQGVKGGGDPLGAMYFVAAVLMAIGALVVVLSLFVPRDLLTRDSEDVYVPGSGETYVAPGNAPPNITPEEAARLEELHAHCASDPLAPPEPRAPGTHLFEERRAQPTAGLDRGLCTVELRGAPPGPTPA